MLEALHFIAQLADPDFIIQWGSLFFLIFIVFAECSFLVGFLLPGNSLIFFAGVAVNNQPQLLNISLSLLIVYLSIAAAIGYWIGYWFGFKKMGPKCLTPTTKIFFFKKKSIEFTIKFYENHGGKTLILGRFLPLIRNFAPVIAGMIKMDYRKYMIYNFIGALVWIASLSLSGYYFGATNLVKDYLDFVTLGLIIAAAGIIYFVKKVG
jgi:membrane-associated protein